MLRALRSLGILSVLLLFFSITSSGETISPRQAYEKIQEFAKAKDWGKVYDSFDSIAQKVLNPNIYMNCFLLLGKEVNEEEIKKLSPRDRYIMLAGRVDRDNEGPLGVYIDLSLGLNSVKSVDKDKADIILNTKDNRSEVVHMRFIGGEWKIHLVDEDSLEYKINAAIEAGDKKELERLYLLLAKEREDQYKLEDQQRINNMFAEACNAKSDAEKVYAVLNVAYKLSERLDDKPFHSDEVQMPDNIFKKFKESIELLISKGVNINARREQFEGIVDNPILIEALKFKNNKEVITFLLDKGADINARIRQKTTGGKVVIEEGGFILDKSIKDIDFFKFLISRGVDVNLRDVFGRTPLMLVVQATEQRKKIDSEMAIIKLLIEKGARINEVDNFGKTALFYAVDYCEPSRVEIARYLVSKGADVSIRDKYGNTAAAALESFGSFNGVLKPWCKDLKVKEDYTNILKPSQKQ